jgi:DNA-binding MarR family transcriptional regulator
MTAPTSGEVAVERALSGGNGEDDRIVLGLLNSVEEGATSQRRIAADLGIALGLVNAYLKRCIKKGLVKVSEAPARRYAYYLTPQGFSEKSRLTVEYLSLSFSFFRQAKADCAVVFAKAASAGMKKVVLAGRSDLTDIAILCAADSDIEIIALVDPAADITRMAGVDVVKSYDEVAVPFDGVVITSVVESRKVFDAAIARYGAERVLAPQLLRLSAEGNVQ